MKRDRYTHKSSERTKLILRRDTLRALQEDALHEVRGGAGGYADSSMMREA